MAWILCCSGVGPAAAVAIQPLAWELPCAVGTMIKSKKKKKKKATKKQAKYQTQKPSKDLSSVVQVVMDTSINTLWVSPTSYKFNSFY